MTALPGQVAAAITGSSDSEPCRPGRELAVDLVSVTAFALAAGRAAVTNGNSHKMFCGYLSLRLQLFRDSSARSFKLFAHATSNRTKRY